MERNIRMAVQWSALGCCCLFAVGCQLGPPSAGDVSPKFLAEASPASDVTASSDVTGSSSSVATVSAEVTVSLADARALEQHGKLQEAGTAYQRLLGEKATSNNYKAAHRLAVIHDRLGNHEEAAAYYQQALQANDSDAELLCDYGYSCYLQGRLARAEAQLRQALGVQPTLSRAQNNLGLVLAQMGREDESQQWFAAAGCTAAETKLNVAIATSKDLGPTRERVLNQLAQEAVRRETGSDSSVYPVEYQAQR